MHFASENGHLATVNFLLSSNANIDAKQMFQWTPLFLASQNNQTAVVELLSSKKEVSVLPKENLEQLIRSNDFQLPFKKEMQNLSCTFPVTKKTFSLQFFFNCHTCDKNVFICYACAQVCHKGHYLEKVKPFVFLGHCGCYLGLKCCLVQTKDMDDHTLLLEDKI
uniref:Uncharacterized protein n=1 Tax=Arcella intermedia TaxID=1963864 RepID=A0A6B2LL85_9EUKA